MLPLLAEAPAVYEGRRGADLMLHLNDISKAYGGRTLFEGLSWHVGPGERAGLVGRNGVGKTTLFRIITGIERPDSGEVVRAKHVRVGLLAQETEGFGGRLVLEAVLDAAGEVRELEQEKARLEAAMAEGVTDDATLRRYELVQARFETLGGYGVEAEARRILAGLGFRQEDMTRPATELSGGWLMRIALARLLLARPELLLLDEPTNHLDLESLLWFEAFLTDYPGSVIIISHDRALLNRAAERIAELTPRGIDVYTGGFDAYLEQREARRALQESAARNQEKVVAQRERFIERFRAKNTKAKAVQSKIKQLEKMERVLAPEDDAPSVAFRFPTPPRSGKDVIACDGVVKRYGHVTVYDGLDLLLRRGQRVALVGPNGAGKSTLMKLLAGTLEPDGGEVRLGHGVERAFFAQHQVEALDLSRTALEEIEAASDHETFPLCRGILGAFQFSGEDVDKRVGVLSGGEKARLALAKMMLRPANLLLLDEPTNHLDMPTRGVLEQALADFPGTLILISHDRHFIDAVATDVLEVIDGEVRWFPGSFEDYAYKKQQLGEPLLGRRRPEDRAEAGETDAAGQGADRGRETDRERKRREAQARNAHHRRVKPLRERFGVVEARVAEVEESVAALEARMLEPGFFEDADRVREVTTEKAALEDEQERLLEEWESLGTELEQAEAELTAELEAGS